MLFGVVRLPGCLYARKDRIGCGGFFVTGRGGGREEGGERRGGVEYYIYTMDRDRDRIE